MTHDTDTGGATAASADAPLDGASAVPRNAREVA